MADPASEAPLFLCEAARPQASLRGVLGRSIFALPKTETHQETMGLFAYLFVF